MSSTTIEGTISERVSVVIDGIVRSRDLAVDEALSHKREQTKVGTERYFRSYARAVRLALIVDQLREAIGQPASDWTMPEARDE